MPYKNRWRATWSISEWHPTMSLILDNVFDSDAQTGCDGDKQCVTSIDHIKQNDTLNGSFTSSDNYDVMSAVANGNCELPVATLQSIYVVSSNTIATSFNSMKPCASITQAASKKHY